MVLFSGQPERPLEGFPRRIRRSLRQVALPDEDLHDHPIGLPSQGHLQMFPRSGEITGIEQGPPETEPSQLVFGMRLHQLTLPCKAIVHEGEPTSDPVQDQRVFPDRRGLARIPLHPSATPDGPGCCVTDREAHHPARPLDEKAPAACAAGATPDESTNRATLPAVDESPIAGSVPSSRKPPRKRQDIAKTRSGTPPGRPSKAEHGSGKTGRTSP